MSLLGACCRQPTFQMGIAKSMTTITIEDEDQGRVYELSVDYRCRPEIGAPGYCVDIERVSLESCTVWLGKCGMEVRIDTEHLASWEREIARSFDDEIRAACLNDYRERRCVA
jgi:hypothetical protein